MTLIALTEKTNPYPVIPMHISAKIAVSFVSVQSRGLSE